MMATPDQTQAMPPPTQMGPCPNCGAPMSPDQRYCLNCGARRGAPRVGPATAGDVVEVAPAAARPADVSPLAAVIGIALLGGMLLIGVLIGRSGSDDNQAPAPIVQVDPAQTTPTTPGTTTPVTPPSATGAVTTDWPTDAQGFTIQLSLVPKDGATQESVDAAKQAATSAGAKEVGVLDSDLYPSLTPGNYVVYSGIYTDRQPAVAALGKLGEGFPDASVIEVQAPVKDTATPETVPEDPAATGEAPVVPPEDEGAAN